MLSEQLQLLSISDQVSLNSTKHLGNQDQHNAAREETAEAHVADLSERTEERDERANHADVPGRSGTTGQVLD